MFSTISWISSTATRMFNPEERRTYREQWGRDYVEMIERMHRDFVKKLGDFESRNVFNAHMSILRDQQRDMSLTINQRETISKVLAWYFGEKNV